MPNGAHTLAEAAAAPYAPAMGRRNLAYWALQAGGWLFYFNAQASGEVIFTGTPWENSVTVWGGHCLACMAATHLFRNRLKRHAWLELPAQPFLWRILAATLFLALALGLCLTLLSLAINGVAVAPLFEGMYRNLPPGRQLLNQFLNALALSIGWVAIYLGFAMQKQRTGLALRQAQLSEALQGAELRLLKAQLNPHFLFNALNGVRALIAVDPARAQDAVTGLARALRYTLAAGEEDCVTLARELEMVEDYLALEALRLAERLTVERAIDPAALGVRLPAMLLQTLVENAIKHGIAPLKQGGVLDITVWREGAALLLRVTNPRPQADGESRNAGSLGLKNLQQRLRLLFGEAAILKLDLLPGRAVAEVRLPS